MLNYAPLHVLIVQAADSLALVADSVTHEQFVRALIGYFPAGSGRRDYRRTRARRALERSLERGDTPFEVTPTHFIFNKGDSPS
jgi:hypothetical protein